MNPTTQQTFADSLTLSAEVIIAGITELLPLCQYGPDYNRSVNSKVADARLFLGRGQLDAATHYYQLARCAAEQTTWEEYLALDPFKVPKA